MCSAVCRRLPGCHCLSVKDLTLACHAWTHMHIKASECELNRFCLHLVHIIWKQLPLFSQLSFKSFFLTLTQLSFNYNIICLVFVMEDLTLWYKTANKVSVILPRTAYNQELEPAVHGNDSLHVFQADFSWEFPHIHDWQTHRVQVEVRMDSPLQGGSKTH
jgi:hypothetical protein